MFCYLCFLRSISATRYSLLLFLAPFVQDIRFNSRRLLILVVHSLFLCRPGVWFYLVLFLICFHAMYEMCLNSNEGYRCHSLGPVSFVLL